MAEHFTAFGSPEYFALLACLAVSRALDFFSTWLATPNLLLEANPIARAMGWKIGIGVNVLLCAAFALWPLPAMVIATTSILVAARNFQSAWLMRSMGELSYRLWMGERLLQAGRGLFLFCLTAQTALYTLVGATLLFFTAMGARPEPAELFAGWRVVPFGIGMGMITFGIAVFVYSLLSVWRMGRARL